MSKEYADDLVELGKKFRDQYFNSDTD